MVIMAEGASCFQRKKTFVPQQVLIVDDACGGDKISAESDNDLSTSAKDGSDDASMLIWHAANNAGSSTRF